MAVSETGRIGWGIIGTGRIANDFAADLRSLPNAALAAVLSRDAAVARTFAAGHGAAAAYSDRTLFLKDPSVDAVYIATPNSSHLEQALACIRAGKPVLVEKPLAMNSAQAAQVAAAAADTGVFAMEAMWMRFLPGMMRLRELVRSGALGKIHSIRGQLGFHHPLDVGSRLYDKSLGGGAALDLGVYLLSASWFLLGKPLSVSGDWRAAPTGVDSGARFRLEWDGATAALECAIDRDLPNRLEIEGSAATARVSAPFIRAGRIEIGRGGIAKQLMGMAKGGVAAKLLSRLPFPGHGVENHEWAGHGLQFQAEAVRAALATGQTGEPRMPLAENCEILAAIESILARPPLSQS